jgi:hypothetical protein
MALTFSNLKYDVEGTNRVVRGTVAFDSSYASGGETLTPSVFGLNTLVNFNVINAEAGYSFEYLPTTGKLKVYFGSASHTHGIGSYVAANESSHTHAATGLTVTGIGTKYVAQAWPYIKGATNTDAQAADQNASPTNGAHFSALAAADNVTPITITTNVDCPRNVVVVHKNASGGAGVAQVACVYAVVGVYNGAAQTENISFTDTSSVADTKFRYLYGVKPYDSVTSITPSIAQNASMQRSGGLGAKLGLSQTLATPAEADVVKITKQGATVAVTSLVDTTNNTVNCASITDNDNIIIKYKVNAYTATPATAGSTAAGSAHTHTTSGTSASTTATAATEVTASTDLATLLATCEFEAIGL